VNNIAKLGYFNREYTNIVSPTMQLTQLEWLSLFLIQVILHEPVCVVEFSRCKALGRVSLRSLGRTIAVGLVTRIIEEQG
jgi:translation elongation factor EF-1alpha